MDGSNRQVLVTGVDARSLALDYEANDLYWADWDTRNIECISLNGGDKRTVSDQRSVGEYSGGISLSEERVYWTFTSNVIVNSITKSGLTMKRLSLPAGRSGPLHGIVFVPEQCPKYGFSKKSLESAVAMICLESALEFANSKDFFQDLQNFCVRWTTF
ncbi:hypothetical protein BV898_14083 [Hypsibius exemplaris]|uniref:Low-density lipoprotein receptor-related protein 6 n=1 Tax=Hypsibius exemplaris TaxID=2072580 RepID=A0A1W0W8P3_HYPEX|nr:hypothetical protein BV898_14083 [Hypsibius exemplaris]